MDENELYSSLMQDIRSKSEAQRDRLAVETLVSALMDEARGIQGRVKGGAPDASKQVLARHYAEIDRDLGRLKGADLSGAVPETNATIAEVRAGIEARRKGPHVSPSKREEAEADIERGRRHLLDRASAGAGDATHKRIREEIDYLMAHYSASNDNRIDQLIDKWRRSGDPSYSPEVRNRFRVLQKKVSKSSQAF